MNVGFIGLGALGQAIIKRLISQGIKVTVWNRTIEKAQKLNLPYVENPEDLLQKRDILILCLTDSKAVKDILNKLSDNLQNKIIIDITTNHFPTVLEFHKFLKNKGGFYLETPVLGSVIPAEKGLLNILVSGEEKVLKEVKPILNIIGQKIFYLEEPGKATKAKLINNYVVAMLIISLASGINFGEAVGFTKEEIIEILSSGSGNSYLLNAKKEKILKEDFTPHFSVNNMLKDLYYVDDLFKEISRVYIEGTLAKELFKLTKNLGYGEEDFSAIYKTLKILNNIKEG
ncbi:NAD(P)-dependent oxidoreductase [Thermodesulfobacterium hydrogeniphilum]|uniref:NAD(P)-dependent oxidoreductase n=1 Tax=Thermodesulfobacterium hydrogeniphilum TaxID=161156 RepID=UPI00056E67EA|nr:NAD(P)-dependent oxidoreductase [Thermodesulfobacterium hydrogeniphilum]